MLQTFQVKNLNVKSFIFFFVVNKEENNNESSHTYSELKSKFADFEIELSHAVRVEGNFYKTF